MYRCITGDCDGQAREFFDGGQDRNDEKYRKGQTPVLANAPLNGYL